MPLGGRISISRRVNCAWREQRRVLSNRATVLKTYVHGLPSDEATAIRWLVETILKALR